MNENKNINNKYDLNMAEIFSLPQTLIIANDVLMMEAIT
jgi:hypothetical protein